jgi:hypothetical protein
VFFDNLGKGTWCLVLGTWCLVLGSRYLVIQAISQALTAGVNRIVNSAISYPSPPREKRKINAGVESAKSIFFGVDGVGVGTVLRFTYP